MKQFIKKVLDWIFPFRNTTEGSSARKLTAFALTLCVIYVHIKFVNHRNAVEVIIIDLLAILLLLGIVTIQNIIELKMGYKYRDTPKKEEL